MQRDDSNKNSIIEKSEIRQFGSGSWRGPQKWLNTNCWKKQNLQDFRKEKSLPSMQSQHLLGEAGVFYLSFSV